VPTPPSSGIHDGREIFGGFRQVRKRVKPMRRGKEKPQVDLERGEENLICGLIGRGPSG